jgi:hypothetical protein
MPQTVWTQAATAILSALNASGAPAKFYRARFEAVSESETAGNLYPTKIDCKYDCAQDSVKIDASMVMRANVAAGNEVDLVADPIVLWAWRRIRLDATLGQLVEDTTSTTSKSDTWISPQAIRFAWI